MIRGFHQRTRRTLQRSVRPARRFSSKQRRESRNPSRFAGYNLYSLDWQTGACFGTGAAAVLTTGAQVTIAVGTLTDPQLMEADLVGSGDRSGFRRVGCRYTFTVTDVPAGHQFYGLHIGDQTRQVAAREVTTPVELTIGSVPAGATAAS